MLPLRRAVPLFALIAVLGVCASASAHPLDEGRQDVVFPVHATRDSAARDDGLLALPMLAGFLSAGLAVWAVVMILVMRGRRRVN